MNFSCIYRIECIDPDVKEIYIGSTGNLRKRIAQHKHYCYNENSLNYNFKVYKYIRDNDGWDNFNVVVEVKTPNHSKEELKELEQIYLDLLEPQLNNNSANGLDKEKKKAYNLKYIKDYYSKIKANCPQCGKEMLKSSIWSHLKKACKNNYIKDLPEKSWDCACDEICGECCNELILQK